MKIEDIDTFKKIILFHYKKYSLMNVQDITKLIYQNVFGPKHMIINKKLSMKNLKEEYNNIKDKSCSECFIDIGNGLYRIDIRAINKFKLNFSTLNMFFYNTAKLKRGTKNEYINKINTFIKYNEAGIVNFKKNDVENYFKKYDLNKCIPVSHSDVYKQKYNPHYRVIDKKYIKFIEIFKEIDNLLENNKVVNIAIDGKCAAGKSSLAELIYKVYESNLFHMDDFFLRPEMKTEERLKEIGGNVDYERFKKEVINNISNQFEGFKYGIYNCKEEKITKHVNVKAKQLNIIEGSYSMHPTLIDSYNLKIFLDIDKEEQSKRITRRNGPIMHKRFVEEWIPKENQYFSKMRIIDKADIVY